MENIPSPSPPSTTRPVLGFRSITASMLGHVTAAFAVAGAFGWLAGFTFLDRVYRAFGLSFGAVAPTVPEVVAMGYLSTIYAGFRSLKDAATLFAISAVIAGSIVALLALAIKTRLTTVDRIRAFHERFEPTADRARGPILFGCFAFVALLAAGPFGYAAAQAEIDGIRKSVKNGCCFDYQSGERHIVGRMVASTADTIYVQGTARLEALKTENLVIRAIDSPMPAPAPRTAKPQKP